MLISNFWHVFAAVLPALVILFYVYKQDQLPEPKTILGLGGGKNVVRPSGSGAEPQEPSVRPSARPPVGVWGLPQEPSVRPSARSFFPLPSPNIVCSEG